MARWTSITSSSLTLISNPAGAASFACRGERIAALCRMIGRRSKIGCSNPNGVIFVTPVYAMNVTALMKNFLDRFAYILHPSRFFQQRAMIVSAEALGLKEAVDRIVVIKFSGFDLVHRAGFVTPGNCVSASSKKRIDRGISEAGEKFFAILNSGLTTSPGLINLIAFRSQQAAFGLLHEYGLGEADYGYFQERGWLDKKRRYFTDVEGNP